MSEDRERLARVWDEGRDYARNEIARWASEYRGRFPEGITAADTQPVFAAIDASPSRLNYRQYNDRIHYIALTCMVDDLTVHPEIVTDEGTYEADDDPNPYRMEA